MTVYCQFNIHILMFITPSFNKCRAGVCRSNPTIRLYNYCGFVNSGITLIVFTSEDVFISVFLTAILSVGNTVYRSSILLLVWFKKFLKINL